MRYAWIVGTLAVTVAWAGLTAAEDREREGGRGREREREGERRGRVRNPPVPLVNPAAPAVVQRGAYLVNEVARCGDCHTPRDNRGELDLARHLQGARMWFTPRVRRGEWEGEAPDITAGGKAGRWKEDRMVRYLSGGGEESNPPMPSYHLTVADAQAVTAYLRSLPGRGNAGGRRERDD